VRDKKSRLREKKFIQNFGNKTISKLSTCKNASMGSYICLGTWFVAIIGGWNLLDFLITKMLQQDS